MNACESVSDDACSFDAMTQYDLLNKNYNSVDHFFVLPFFFSCNHFTLRHCPGSGEKGLKHKEVWQSGHLECETWSCHL